mgnify:CR=1 FL=1
MIRTSAGKYQQLLKELEKFREGEKEEEEKKGQREEGIEK